MIDLVEPSDFTQSGTHIAVLDWAMQLAGADIALLKDLVFSIILPDAVIGRKSLFILNDCERNGYVPVYCELIQDSSERLFEKLYLFNHAKTDLGGTWWLNRQIYQMAPVIAVVFKKINASSVSAHADFRNLKGPSSPYLAQPGQLRHDHHAVNRCLSLVHSSDEPLSSIRELKLFVGDVGFDNMLSIARHTTTVEGLEMVRASCLVKLRRFELALAAFGAETDFLRVLLGLNYRLASTFLRNSDDAGARILFSALSSLEQAAFQDEPLLHRTRRFIAACRSEANVLSSLAGDHTENATAVALKLLCTTDQFSADAALAIIRAAQSAEVPVTPWERIVLLTSMHYWSEAEEALAKTDALAVT